MSEEEKSKRIKFIIEIKDSILFLDEENSRYVIEEIERLKNVVHEIRNVVNNEKVSGIEAKLIIKDILGSDKEWNIG